MPAYAVLTPEGDESGTEVPPVKRPNLNILTPSRSLLCIYACVRACVFLFSAFILNHSVSTLQGSKLDVPENLDAFHISFTLSLFTMFMFFVYLYNNRFDSKARYAPLLVLLRGSRCNAAIMAIRTRAKACLVPTI